MAGKYYLPINSDNLGLYFSSAIIVPHNYLKDTVNDLQSLATSSLVISNKLFTLTSDCSLEVVLTKDEISSLIIDSLNIEIYYLNMPLPITRVSKILFYSNEKMRRTISLAESSSFIPERLIQLVNSEESYFINENKNDKYNNLCSKNDTNKHIDLYNRYLGGFAFMKLGGEVYMNYSFNYFSTLAFFNKIIESEILNINSKIKLNFENSFHGLFKEPDNNWKVWFDFIYGNDENIVQYLINEKIFYSNNLFKKDMYIKNRKHYILSILANYGHFQNKSLLTDSLIIEILTDKIPQEYKELVTLFYGVHNGYNGFNKSYHFNTISKPLKFKFDSTLDYYTIESIYQFVFNNKISNDFDYLNDVMPKFENHVDNNKYKSYKILDKEIIYAQKPTTFEDLLDGLIDGISIKKILSSLIKNCANKISITFTEEQINILNKEYSQVIREPLKEYVKEISNEIRNFYEDRIGNINKDFESKMSLIYNTKQNITYEKNSNKEMLVKEESKVTIDNEILLIHKLYLKKLNNTALKEIADSYQVTYTKEELKDNTSFVNKILDAIKLKNKLL